MTVQNNAVPNYYRYMYLDGYKPEEILNAVHQKMWAGITEKEAIPKVHIISEVRLK